MTRGRGTMWTARSALLVVAIGLLLAVVAAQNAVVMRSPAFVPNSATPAARPPASSIVTTPPPPSTRKTPFPRSSGLPSKLKRGGRAGAPIQKKAVGGTAAAGLKTSAEGLLRTTITTPTQQQPPRRTPTVKRPTPASGVERSGRGRIRPSRAAIPKPTSSDISQLLAQPATTPTESELAQPAAPMKAKPSFFRQKGTTRGARPDQTVAPKAGADEEPISAPTPVVPIDEEVPTPAVIAPRPVIHVEEEPAAVGPSKATLPLTTQEQDEAPAATTPVIATPVELPKQFAPPHELTVAEDTSVVEETPVTEATPTAQKIPVALKEEDLSASIAELEEKLAKFGEGLPKRSRPQIPELEVEVETATSGPATADVSPPLAAPADQTHNEDPLDIVQETTPAADVVTPLRRREKKQPPTATAQSSELKRTRFAKAPAEVDDSLTVTAVVPKGNELDEPESNHVEPDATPVQVPRTVNPKPRATRLPTPSISPPEEDPVALDPVVAPEETTHAAVAEVPATAPVQSLRPVQFPPIVEAETQRPVVTTLTPIPAPVVPAAEDLLPPSPELTPVVPTTDIITIQAPAPQLQQPVTPPPVTEPIVVPEPVPEVAPVPVAMPVPDAIMPPIPEYVTPKRAPPKEVVNPSDPFSLTDNEQQMPVPDSPAWRPVPGGPGAGRSGGSGYVIMAALFSFLLFVCLKVKRCLAAAEEADADEDAELGLLNGASGAAGPAKRAAQMIKPGSGHVVLDTLTDDEDPENAYQAKRAAMQQQAEQAPMASSNGNAARGMSLKAGGTSKPRATSAKKGRAGLGAVQLADTDNDD